MLNAVETLRTLLSSNIVRFTFRKVDGTIRTAIGTRNLTIAQAYLRTKAETRDFEIPIPKGEEQPYSYYDLEKNGWRSFRPTLLVSIDGVVDMPETPVREIPVERVAPVSETPVDRLPIGGGISVGIPNGTTAKIGGVEVPVKDIIRLVLTSLGGVETENEQTARELTELLERAETIKEQLRGAINYIDNLVACLKK